jgi:hypothetical protein
MGSKRIVIHHVAEKLGDIASNVEVTDTDIVFEIPATVLFQSQTAIPTARFVELMQDITSVTAGLEESNVYIDSEIFRQGMPGGTPAAKDVAEKRLDLISAKVEARLEHPTVDIFGKAEVKEARGDRNTEQLQGSIKFTVRAKENLINKKSDKKFNQIFGNKDESMDVYNNFVKQISNRSTTTIKKGNKR